MSPPPVSPAPPRDDDIPPARDAGRLAKDKRASARLGKLARLRTAISITNRAIIRSQSPAEVYRAVCRACIEQTDVKLAWIGVADESGERIVPVEVAGAAVGYLADRAITLSPEDPEGHEPAAVGYREQRAYFCNDFPRDVGSAAWRERAFAHGLRAVVALPLLRGGKPYGMLAAYGSERNFFDADSVEMLLDMADNVSFAIDQFDRREERRRAEEKLRASESMFRTLVESLPQRIFVKDSHLIYLSCNEHYAHELGVPKESIAGKTDFELMAPEAADKYRQDDLYVLRSSTVVEFEEKRGQGASQTFSHVVRAPFRNDAGQIVGVIGASWDVTAARRAEAELARFATERALQAERFENLSRRLVAVQENERRALARELHDRANPNLAAIKLILATVEGALPAEALAAVRAMLMDIQGLVEDTAAGIREICANLRPTLLDYTGLVPTLESYAEMFAKRTGVPVRLNVPHGWARLDQEVECMLFRVTQEALTNCAKHACARNVEIELQQAERRRILVIRDDGFGFEPEALGQGGNAPGHGLISMKERAEFAGARFSLSSHPLNGTEVRVELDASADLPAEPAKLPADLCADYRKPRSEIT
ncbi:MAG TPA: GAF domain-containing protein [Rhodocyclaceae bacterium]